ncbi:hypothetical protein EYF80_036035 [Liparis tanakae]|uniref:Uncharacterized protein n=1 Tax=Liparis tanakae TaxID=230148 RepID=A0A4Z2GJP0_9TELE|nr:hypothetical protein EYF80_036035 [Liparis tanakae]
MDVVFLWRRFLTPQEHRWQRPPCVRSRLLTAHGRRAFWGFSPDDTVTIKVTFGVDSGAPCGQKQKCFRAPFRKLPILHGSVLLLVLLCPSFSPAGPTELCSAGRCKTLELEEFLVEPAGIQSPAVDSRRAKNQRGRIESHNPTPEGHRQALQWKALNNVGDLELVERERCRFTANRESVDEFPRGRSLRMSSEAPRSGIQICWTVVRSVSPPRRVSRDGQEALHPSRRR